MLIVTAVLAPCCEKSQQQKCVFNLPGLLLTLSFRRASFPCGGQYAKAAMFTVQCKLTYACAPHPHLCLSIICVCWVDRRGRAQCQRRLISVALSALQTGLSCKLLNTSTHTPPTCHTHTHTLQRATCFNSKLKHYCFFKDSQIH